MVCSLLPTLIFTASNSIPMLLRCAANDDLIPMLFAADAA
jgi:hypothetical protein